MTFQIRRKPTDELAPDERSAIHALPYQISAPLSRSYAGPSVDMDRDSDMRPPLLRWETQETQETRVSDTRPGSPEKFPFTPLDFSRPPSHKLPLSPTDSDDTAVDDDYSFYGTLRFWAMFFAMW